MKQIVLVFKNGVTIPVTYSSKVYAELSDNLGKDHKVEAKNFTVNTKNVDGIFFQVVEVEESEEA